MSEHTPGPWFVHDFSEICLEQAPQVGDVTVSCDHPATITVARMGRALTATIEEARANARLIAAAPDLLEAMEGIVHFSDAVAYREDILSVSLRQWIDAGRSAIAKAEGTTK